MSTIGIDLGTTNTVVAMVYDDGPHVVPRENGRLIPSVVGFESGKADAPAVVGEQADRLGPEQAAIRSIKRLMGRTHEQALAEDSGKFFSTEPGGRLVEAAGGDVQVEVNAGWAEPRRFWPHEISAHILREAKAHAERCLKRSVEAAAITVPAYFHDSHRQATLDAARIAGLEVIGHVLDEPSAAAFAFGSRVGFGVGEPILVVDWGGGTLDVTIQISDGQEWQQIAIDGHLTLGGDDIDWIVATLALRKAGLSEDLLRDHLNWHELRKPARAAKERLSAQASAPVACARLIDARSGERLRPLGVSLSIDEYEQATAEVIGQAAGVVDRCLQGSDVAREHISKVLLVGGSSHIPAFRRALSALLPKARLHDDVDPAHSVALGAAIFANARPALSRISVYGYAVIHEGGEERDVLPANSETPTPEFAHVAVPALTRYPAQTIYRLTLSRFTEHAGERMGHGTVRLFARELPPTAQGTPVDVEIWLDEQKDLRAACHVHDGRAVAVEVQASDGRGIFSELLDASLDAESLLEANQKAERGGLVERLKAGFGLSQSALESRSQEHAQSALTFLRDLKDQVLDHRRWVVGEALPPDHRARQRVAGWVAVHERETLPFFWDVLAEPVREEAVEILRSLRVMLQTGASGQELEVRLVHLHKVLEPPGHPGAAIQAFRMSNLLGVPDRLAAMLRSASLELRDALVAEDAQGIDEARAQLDALSAEAGGAWKSWLETDALVDASPDLIVLKETARHVH